MARYPRDRSGQPLQSNYVHLVLTDRHLYWIQAARTGLPWGGSEIEQCDLATGYTRTAYRGLALALVPVGNMLIFTGVVPGADRSRTTPPLQTLALDQETGRLERAPAGITAAADGADTMRQDGGIVVWDTSRGGLRAWSARWGRSVTVVPALGAWSLGDRLQLTGVGYPGSYGRFVTSYSGRPYVLDLRTGSFTGLATRPGGLDLSGPQLEIEQYASSGKPSAPPFYLDQTLIDLSTLPDPAGCKP